MPKKERLLLRLRRWAGWWLLIGGGAALATGLGFVAWRSVFLFRATETDARILRTEPVEDGESGATSFAPVFTFVAADGRTYTITSDTSSNPPGYEAGEKARVLYIRSDPTQARLESLGQLWLFPLIIGPLGFFYASIGWVLLWFDRRYLRRMAIAP